MNEDTRLSVRFALFASQTIAFETGGDKSGDYTNDPTDPGGETKWGISKRAHPELNIKALTYSDALNIYYNDYWDDRYGDIISDRLAFKLFDIGILIGKGKVVRLLQKSINSCGYLIRVDGNFGPISAAATNSVINQDLLYDRFIAILEGYFKRIVLFRPKRRKYLKGWLRRLNYVWKVN